MKTALIIVSLILVMGLPAWSGEIKTWTDEEGVTHIEIKGHKSRKTSYRKPKKSKSLNQLDVEHQKKIRKLELKLEREQNERERNRQKEKNKREIERAKEKYERLKKSEAKYRKYYHDAYNREDMEYWWNKLKEIDEARSEYLKLQNQ